MNNTENGFIIYYSEMYNAATYGTWVNLDWWEEPIIVSGFKRIDNDEPIEAFG